MAGRLQKIIFPAVILVVFIVILMQSLDLPATSRKIPEGISVIAIVLLVLQIIEDLRSKIKNAEHSSAGAWWKDKSFLTGLTAVLYVAAINVIGYVVSTLLFMAALMTILGMRGKLLFILSPAVAIVSWVVFAKFFNVNIPHGWLF